GIIPDQVTQELLAKEKLVGAHTALSFRELITTKGELSALIQHRRFCAEEPLGPAPGRPDVAGAAAQTVAEVSRALLGEGRATQVLKGRQLRCGEAGTRLPGSATTQRAQIGLAPARIREDPILQVIAVVRIALLEHQAVDLLEELRRDPVGRRLQNH